MTTTPAPPVVGPTEIAAMLGLTRVRVHQLSTTDPTFPQPIAIVGGGRVWNRADIEQWAQRAGRTINTAEEVNRPTPNGRQSA